MSRYRIKEIFGPTIQGEGSQTGLSVIFLRFAGCNRWTGRLEDKPSAVCWFCDTDFYGGTRMSSEEILERIRAVNTNNYADVIVISGGEPTIQLDRELCSDLVDAGFRLHLETNGSRDIAEYSEFIDHISCSPKQPLAETKLRAATDLKLLYPFLKGASPEMFSSFPAKNRFIQPIHGYDFDENVTQARDVILKYPDYRLSIQLHKVLGVP